MRIRTISLLLLAFVLALGARALPVRIIATGDMHGWLQAQSVDGRLLGGAGEILAAWQRDEQYDPAHWLLISCGDTATGPALATVFKNDPVINVMNLMHYDVSALGNHEFDYGKDSLARWRRTATFPFVTANLVNPDGTPADFAPFVINDEQGVKVAVIGLTTSDVAQIAKTDGITAQAYADALRKTVPLARAQGAQVIVVAAHVAFPELVALAQQVKDLNIPLMLGGHDHSLGQTKVPGTETWVVNNGEWWKSYTRIDLDYTPQTGKSIVMASKQAWVLQAGVQADPAIAQEIARWQNNLTTEFTVKVGYTANGLKRPAGVYNFIADCWLASDPTADIVLMNSGGLRQDFAPGDITRKDVWGVMPFTNSLFRIEVTGRDLLAYLPAKDFIGLAGLTRKAGRYYLARTGKPLAPKKSYRVLLNDYMYQMSPILTAADRTPETLFPDWRTPIFDWLTQHPTGMDKPLETLVDMRPRTD